MKYFTKKDAIILEEILSKYRGVKNNPLNGLTFKEILDIAKKK